MDFYTMAAETFNGGRGTAQQPEEPVVVVQPEAGTLEGPGGRGLSGEHGVRSMTIRGTTGSVLDRRGSARDAGPHAGLSSGAKTSSCTSRIENQEPEA